MTIPVLVAGGGPSGLAAAIELGRRGIEVLVVEPRTELDRCGRGRRRPACAPWSTCAAGGWPTGSASAPRCRRARPGRRLLHLGARPRAHPVPERLRAVDRAAGHRRGVRAAGAPARGGAAAARRRRRAADRRAAPGCPGDRGARRPRRRPRRGHRRRRDGDRGARAVPARRRRRGRDQPDGDRRPLRRVLGDRAEPVDHLPLARPRRAAAVRAGRALVGRRRGARRADGPAGPRRDLVGDRAGRRHPHRGRRPGRPGPCLRRRGGRRRRRGAGHRPLVGPDAAGRPLPRGAGVPGRRRRAPEPAVGWARLQHLRRRRGEPGLEAGRGAGRLGAAGAAGQLRARAPSGGRADHRRRRRAGVLHRGPVRRRDADADGPEGDAVRAELAAALQVKDPEFHSLGLVLGYDYADSPSSSPTGPPRRRPTS